MGNCQSKNLKRPALDCVSLNFSIQKRQGQSYPGLSEPKHTGHLQGWISWRSTLPILFTEFSAASSHILLENSVLWLVPGIATTLEAGKSENVIAFSVTRFALARHWDNWRDFCPPCYIQPMLSVQKGGYLGYTQFVFFFNLAVLVWVHLVGMLNSETCCMGWVQCFWMALFPLWLIHSFLERLPAKLSHLKISRKEEEWPSSLYPQLASKLSVSLNKAW